MVLRCPSVTYSLRVRSGTTLVVVITSFVAAAGLAMCAHDTAGASSYFDRVVAAGSARADAANLAGALTLLIPEALVAAALGLLASVTARRVLFAGGVVCAALMLLTLLWFSLNTVPLIDLYGGSVGVPIEVALPLSVVASLLLGGASAAGVRTTPFGWDWLSAP